MNFELIIVHGKLYGKITLDKEMSGFLGLLLLIGKKILAFWHIAYCTGNSAYFSNPNF